MVAAKVLTSQLAHLVAPGPAAYVPLSQSAHTRLPVVLVYFPPPHGEQVAWLLAPTAAEKVPAAHWRQMVGLLAPTEAE